MLNSPPESYEVRQQWGNRFAGGSKNNPFLKPPEERFTSYNETVAPQKICKGIMEIREQLVSEWLEDLELIPQDNSQFIEDQQKNRSEHKEVMKQFYHVSGSDNLNGVAPQRVDDTAQHAYDSYIAQSIVMAHSASTPLRMKNYDVLKKVSRMLRSGLALLDLLARFYALLSALDHLCAAPAHGLILGRTTRRRRRVCGAGAALAPCACVGHG